MRKLIAVLFTGLLAIAGCSTDPEAETADDTTTSDSDDSSQASGTESDDPRAPGVTGDTIRVGVTYPDLTELATIIGIDHGDYERAYQAVADGLNDAGGIGGRQIELVFAPVDPSASDAETAACTRLAQDEEVFVAVGFFLGDAINCYIDTNEVPVIGGEMTDERLDRAKVPWFTIGTSSDSEADGLEALIEAGVIEDRVAVVGGEVDQGLYETAIASQLEDAGAEVVGPAFVDTSSADQNVINGTVDNILDRFEAEGAEQVLAIGQGAPIYVGPRLAAREYAPQLVMTTLQGATAYVRGEGADTSAAEGSVVAGFFDANNDYDAVDNEPTEECLGFLEAAGHTLRPANDVPEGEPENIVSAMQACRNLYLLAAIVDVAGETLDFGTFRAAGYGLGEIDIVGLPDPASFGPPPSADGDLTQYLYVWDPSTSDYVRRDR